MINLSHWYKNRINASDTYPFLKEIKDTIVERLQFLKYTGTQALSHGLESLPLSPMLYTNIPGSPYIAPDRFPLKSHSLDLLVSFMQLHWMENPQQTFADILRVLKPGGIFIGAFLGGSTLCSLKKCLWHRGDTMPRVLPFIQPRHCQSLLADFSLPVIDRIVHTYRYTSIENLFKSIHQLGEGNALKDREQGLKHPSFFQSLEDTYKGLFPEHKGVQAEIDIICITAFAPHPRDPKALKPGNYITSLHDIL